MYVVIAVWGGDDGPAAARPRQVRPLHAARLGASCCSASCWSGCRPAPPTWSRSPTGAGAGMSRTHAGHRRVRAARVGFAVKTPLWPLHTWLPDAHTAGADGRLGAPRRRAAEDGHVRPGPGRAAGRARRAPQALAPFLGVLAVAGILVGSLVCLRRRPTLKRLIAYSTVGHMGFVLLGIATLTADRHQGALFGNIAHGLITGLLFFLAGAIKDRHGTPADLAELGAALHEPAPRLGGAARLRRDRLASACPAWPGSGARCSRCSARSSPPTGSAARLFLTLLALAAVGDAAHRRVLPAAASAASATGAPAGRAGRRPLADVRGVRVRRLGAARRPARVVARPVARGCCSASTDPAVQQLLAGGSS